MKCERHGCACRATDHPQEHPDRCCDCADEQQVGPVFDPVCCQDCTHEADAA